MKGTEILILCIIVVSLFLCFNIFRSVRFSHYNGSDTPVILITRSIVENVKNVCLNTSTKKLGCFDNLVGRMPIPPVNTGVDLYFYNYKNNLIFQTHLNSIPSTSVWLFESDDTGKGYELEPLQ